MSLQSRLSAFISAVGADIKALQTLAPNATFLATKAATQTAVTAGSWQPVAYGTEVKDSNNVYNPATGRFTAPNDGSYEFNCGFLVSSAVTYAYMGLEVFFAAGGSTIYQVDLSNIVQLSATRELSLLAGDQVRVVAWVDAVRDINVGSGTYFSGHAVQGRGATGAQGPTGNVNALNTGTAAPDPTLQENVGAGAVKWTRLSDGSYVAKADSFRSGTIQTLDIKSRARTDGDQAHTYLQAEENGVWNSFLNMYTAGESSAIEITQSDSATAEPRGKINARAGSVNRKVIASDGTSDFKREITTVTQLPSSPYDGQEVYLNLWSVMGDVIWHMRYTAWAAGTHKWLPVGSPAPARKVVGASDVSRTTLSTTFAELTSQTAVLSMLAPAAGNYEIEWGVAAWWNDTANAYVASACGIGAFTTIPTNSRMKALYTASAAGYTEYGPRGYVVLSDLAKDDEIRIRFSRRVAVGTANVQEPLWMSIKPLQLSRLVV